MTTAGLLALAGPQGRTGTLRVTHLPIATDFPSLPQVEPVVAVHPTRLNQLAVAAMLVQTPQGDGFFESWRVVVYFSSDSGAHWTQRAPPPTPSGPAMGDVSLSWASDGVLYLTALVSARDRTLQTWLWRTENEGRSWTVEAVRPGGRGSEDHPVLDVRRDTKRPTVAVFATTEGITAALLHPARKAFTPTTPYQPNRENNNLGWGLDLGRGRLLFTYYSMSGTMPTPLWAVRSDDTGLTWTRSPVTDRHVPVGFPMLAQDRSRSRREGRVYAVWVSDEETGNLMLAHSDDQGASWSSPVTVQRDRSRVLRARPAVHVNGDGVVAVSWTDGRRDSGGGGAWCWDVFAAISRDGGDSFEPEVPLTDSVTCSQTAGNGQAGRRWRWGGDYSGIASDAAGRFYVTWSDSRTGVYQPRLARLDP